MIALLWSLGLLGAALSDAQRTFFDETLRDGPPYLSGLWPHSLGRLTVSIQGRTKFLNFVDEDHLYVSDVQTGRPETWSYYTEEWPVPQGVQSWPVELDDLWLNQRVEAVLGRPYPRPYPSHKPHSMEDLRALLWIMVDQLAEGDDLGQALSLHLAQRLAGAPAVPLGPRSLWAIHAALDREVPVRTPAERARRTDQEHIKPLQAFPLLREFPWILERLIAKIAKRRLMVVPEEEGPFLVPTTFLSDAWSRTAIRASYYDLPREGHGELTYDLVDSDEVWEVSARLAEELRTLREEAERGEDGEYEDPEDEEREIDLMNALHLVHTLWPHPAAQQNQRLFDLAHSAGLVARDVSGHSGRGIQIRRPSHAYGPFISLGYTDRFLDDQPPSAWSLWDSSLEKWLPFNPWPHAWVIQGSVIREPHFAAFLHALLTHRSVKEAIDAVPHEPHEAHEAGGH